MAEIDSLQIEISASAKKANDAIDKLIGGLGRLDGALNLEFGESLSKNLSSLNSSLSGLGDTIKLFPDDKLKSISKSLKGISNFSMARAASSITKDSKAIGKAVDEATDKFAKEWNISDKGGIEEIRLKMGELYDDVAKGLDTSHIIRDLQEITTRFMDMGLEADATYKQVREILNNNQMILPKSFWADYGDDAKSARAILGIRNTRNYKSADENGQDPYWIAKQLNEKTGLQITDDRDAQIVEEIVNYLKSATENAATLNRQFVEMAGESGAFKDSIENIANTMRNMPKAEIVSETQTVSMEQLAESLKSLEGIHVSAENLGGINTLASAMGRLGGSSAAGAAQYLKSIADGLRALPEVVPSGANYEQLAAGLAKLGGVKVTRGAALNDIAKGLEALKAVGSVPNIEGLEELAHSLSMFGRSTAQNAVTVIPQLATAFRQLIQTLSTAPRISRSVIDLANAMAALTGNMGRSSAATRRQIPLLQQLGNTVHHTARRTQSLAAVFGKIYATYWVLFRAFGKIREAIGYAADLTEVQNVVDTVFGHAKDKVEDFANSAIMSFGMSELSAKQFASRYQAMGSAMGITNAQVVKANEFLDRSLEGSKRKLDGVADSYANLGDSVADMSVNLTKLTADVGSFYNMDYDQVAEKMSAVWTGQTRPMREFGIDLTQATLQEWMLTNGIDGNIKKMTQAEKTMIRYQYVMSQLGHVMNDYARTADTWANVTRTIGQQFQKLGSIIGGGFINAFRPALVRFRDFMNTLISLVEKGINAIGKLLGWQIEISEVGLADDADYAEDLADGLGSAADNAKALNKQLMGFDRLNNISTPSDKGNGSGSGSGTSGGGGGASKSTDPKVTWKKYESDIKNWRDLGEHIADAVSGGLDDINWTEINRKAEQFGKDLAELMNGIFSGEKGKKLFKSLGSTIAKAVNAVMISAKTWADNLEWGKIGDNIREGLVSFLTDWEPEITGEAVGGIAGGIANALYSVVSKKSTWALLGIKIAKGVNGFLKSMGEIDETTGKTGWEAAFGSVSSIITGLGTAIRNSIREIEWDDFFSGLWGGIKEFFSGMSEDTVTGLIGLAVLSKAGRKIIKAVLVGLFGKGGKAKLKTKPELSMSEPNVTKSFTMKSLMSKLASLLGWESLGITGGVATFSLGALVVVEAGLAWKWASGETDRQGKKLTPKVDSNAFGKNTGKQKNASEAFGAATASNALSSQQGGSLDMYALQTVGNAIGAGIQKGIEEWYDNSTNGESIIAKIKKSLEIAAGIHSPAREFYDTGDYIGEGMFEGLKEWLAKTKFGKFISDWKDKLSKKWGNFKLNVGNKFTTTKTNVSKWYDNVKEWWGEKRLDIGNKFTTTKEKVTKWYSDVKDWWGEKKLKIANKFETVKKDVGEWWTNVRDWWNEKKSNLKVKTENTTTSTNVSNWFSKIKSWWGTPSLGVNLSLVSDAVSNLWNSVKTAFNGKTLEIDTKAKNKALGGAFYGDRWHNIAQFASGGRPSHGSMFVAGEAGTEVVGHIGGRTEVLNESQMASVMYDAVSDAIASQNAILIKQNQILTELLAKDYGISSSDIFSATQREANSYQMRTGRPAFGI